MQLADEGEIHTICDLFRRLRLKVCLAHIRRIKDLLKTNLSPLLISLADEINALFQEGAVPLPFILSFRISL